MKNFNKLAMIVVLGSGFAVAQSSMPQSSAPQSTSPSATSPSATQSTPSSTDQQPSTLPNTDQKPSDTAKPSDSSKLPQSDAAPSAAPAAANGDVQGNIQSAIQKDPSLANANVTVNVNEGKSVDLTGTVPTKDAKDAAERIAKENSGGLKVKNHLKVASAGSDANPKTDTSSPSNPKL